MVLRAGHHVAPHLRLVRPLGKGGMGSVWVAHHATLEAEVAVKFIATEFSELDETIMARFKREAALSAKFKSPHVVKTFDHGTMLNGRPYIVMELLEGETLGECLAREKRLSTRDVALVVSQVAQVLSEAHDYTVVHRDIKPDNIFLLSSAYELFVKVLDFGIAKQTSMPHLTTVTDTGAIIGTPEYMSPEQLLSTGSADFRADLWALAVLAYHALTGHAPFTGETLPALSLQICGGRFEPPSTHDAMLPHGLDLWFSKAFTSEPDDRFDDVVTMADSFRRIVAGEEDIGIAPTTPAPTAQRSMASNAGSSSGAHNAVGSSDGTPTSGVSRAGGAVLGDKGVSPDESGPVARIVADGISDTLMSAGGDDARARDAFAAGHRGPDDSGVHAAVAPASPDQSGRRQALTDVFLGGRTPTFSGASSSLSERQRPQRRGLLLAAALATVVLSVGALVNLELPAMGKVATLEPMLPGLYDRHIRAAPASTATIAPSSSAAVGASATAPSTAAPSTAVPHPSADTGPTGGVKPRRPGARRRTQTWPPAGAASASAVPKPVLLPNPCDNPYIANADGTLTVRPECLDP